MVDTLRIKRRAAGGAAGPPASLASAEIAFNEQDNTLYYGKGNSGGLATSILAIAGDVKANLSYVNSQDALNVLKAGDTMTGNLTISKVSPALVLGMTAASQSAGIISYNGANKRWELYLGNANPESGSNAGSDFALNRYSDAGALLGGGNTIFISRATGNATFIGTVAGSNGRLWGASDAFPQVLRFSAYTSGSGTHTTFAGTKIMRVVCQGGGQGGAPGGGVSVAPGHGGNSTFGSITAGGSGSNTGSGGDFNVNGGANQYAVFVNANMPTG